MKDATSSPPHDGIVVATDGGAALWPMEKTKSYKLRITGAPGPGLAVDDAGEQMARYHHGLVTAPELLPIRVRPCG